MRGRKPKPTRLKVIEGNPGRRRLPKNEPKPSPSLKIAAPSILKGAALEEWNRIVGELIRMGVMTGLDTGALAGYCLAWGRLQLAQTVLDEIAERDPAAALMVRTSNGTPIHNPFLSIAQKAAAEMLKFAAEFGMTPAARVRLANSGSNPMIEGVATDPLARLMSMSPKRA